MEFDYSKDTNRFFLGEKDATGNWVGQITDITQNFILTLFKYIPRGAALNFPVKNENNDVSEDIFIHINKNKDSIEETISFLTKTRESLLPEVVGDLPVE